MQTHIWTIIVFISVGIQLSTEQESIAELQKEIKTLKAQLDIMEVKFRKHQLSKYFTMRGEDSWGELEGPVISHYDLDHECVICGDRIKKNQWVYGKTKGTPSGHENQDPVKKYYHCECLEKELSLMDHV